MTVPIEYNTDGKPLRIHELNIEALAKWLNERKVRTTQGKLIQPLHSGHLEVINDPARFKVLACGRRWGKTLIADLMALAVLMQVNRRVMIVGPDYSLAEKVFRELYSTLVLQLKLINPGVSGRARYQKGDFYLETPWGSVLEAKSMENPDSLVGDALDLVIVDEAAIEPKLEDIWAQMLQPTLMDKEGSAVFISTPRGKNSFFKLYLFGLNGIRQRLGKSPISIDPETGISNDMREWASFQRTSYDNPLLAASPEKSKEEIDSAYRRAILSGKLQKFKQEYLADFESVSDLCFPGFVIEKDNKHEFANVIDYIWHPDEGPIYTSCDHNYAKPASTLFAQLNKFNDLVVFDERFSKRHTSFMQAQQILDKEKELTKVAYEIWKKEGRPLETRKPIHFFEIIADISGKQDQLNGRTAWDDFETILKRRPVGLRQDRAIGCDMIRLWCQFPKFDEKGRPILTETRDSATYPKLFVTSNCVNLIYALQTASFKKTKAGGLKEDYEETAEGYEGLLDALRYLMVYLFHDTGQHITVLDGVIN
jgi:hypothetical protein